MAPGVLIVAPPTDDHAPTVAAEIVRQGGRAEFLDLAAFPERARLAMRYDCCSLRQFALRLEGRSLDLNAFSSVWWRRPQAPQVSAAVVRPSHRYFAANEADHALNGLWHAIDPFWINDPKRDEIAHRKPFQLRVAQDVGLPIPDTLITNDPDEARLFVDRHGYRNVIFKSFSATQTEWRETRLLGPEELLALGNVSHAPVIFQEYVEAAYDLRVTLVGRRVFGAAIHSQESAYPVDFRMDMGHARVEPAALPEAVESRLLALMDRLGLVYGAVDMRRTPDDRYVFLEINPAGQFLFIERLTGQPIAAALAAALLAAGG